MDDVIAVSLTEAADLDRQTLENTICSPQTPTNCMADLAFVSVFKSLLPNHCGYLDAMKKQSFRL